MQVIQTKVLENPENWAIRVEGNVIEPQPGQQTTLLKQQPNAYHQHHIRREMKRETYSYAEMSDYDETEAGGSESITCIGRTAPKLDLC